MFTHSCENRRLRANPLLAIMPQVTLTQLPREIRDNIYDFVFTWNEVRPTRLRRNPRYASVYNDYPHQFPSLLLVNRQISAEAAPLFYGNRVWAGQAAELLCFLEKVGDRRNLIKAVEIRSFTYLRPLPCMPYLFSVLSSMSALHSVKLHVSGPTFEPAQTQLAAMGLNSLKGQVEVIIHNHRGYIGDYCNGKWGNTYHDTIWTRAASAMTWVRGEEIVEDSFGARWAEGLEKRKASLAAWQSFGPSETSIYS